MFHYHSGGLSAGRSAKKTRIFSNVLYKLDILKGIPVTWAYMMWVWVWVCVEDYKGMSEI